MLLHILMLPEFIVRLHLRAAAFKIVVGCVIVIGHEIKVARPAGLTKRILKMLSALNNSLMSAGLLKNSGVNNSICVDIFAHLSVNKKIFKMSQLKISVPHKLSQ